jgi:Holliday junction resolvase RusA-like endonuclease
MINARWQFILPINPEPWAIGPVGVTNRGGKMRGFVGKNLQLDNFQNAVRDMLKQQMDGMEGRELFPMAVPCQIKFWFWRRLDSYEGVTGRKSSRNWADATNMQKALEDAIQGVLTGNDKHNHVIASEIVHQAEEVLPGIVIDLRPAKPFSPLEMGIKTFERAVELFEKADIFVFDNTIRKP